MDIRKKQALALTLFGFLLLDAAGSKSKSKSEISNIHHDRHQLKVFSVSWWVAEPISDLLAAIKHEMTDTNRP